VGIQSRIIFLLASITILVAGGCNRPADYALVGSAFVPSAQGEIVVGKADGGEILINMTIDQLVSPERIEAGLTDYVVWFTSVGAAPQRQGTLDYDSNTQIGHASIRTKLREFELQITAEAGETPTRPSDLVVASQKIREN
jgi:hypothetical protein